MATMVQTNISKQIWDKFKSKSGSDYIASPIAIAALIKFLKYEKPKRILEIGAGIGTLTYTIVKILNSISTINHYILYSTENNEFCQTELRKNLVKLKRFFIEIPNVSVIPDYIQDFDFFIVDGGDLKDSGLFTKLGKNSFIFVEGNRKEQSETIENILVGKKYIKANVRNLQRKTKKEGKIIWFKGYRIYKLNPRLSHRIIFGWLRLKTSVVYRLRSLLEKISFGIPQTSNKR